MYKMSNISPRFRGQQNAYLGNNPRNNFNVERMMAGNFRGAKLLYKSSPLGQGILDNHARVMHNAVVKGEKYIVAQGAHEPEMYLVTVTETDPDITYKVTKRIINGQWKDVFLRGYNETAEADTFFYETTPRSAANASRKSRKQRKNRKGTRKNNRRH
jgi:hypothetical protein